MYLSKAVYLFKNEFRTITHKCSHSVKFLLLPSPVSEEPSHLSNWNRKGRVK